ncbi:MAG: hypothetical protein GY795_00155, partial [Desulfobacterales bacterium]|nr:hypothetical protein [Desulfobacterales bacterium]
MDYEGWEESQKQTLYMLERKFTHHARERVKAGDELPAEESMRLFPNEHRCRVIFGNMGLEGQKRFSNSAEGGNFDRPVDNFLAACKKLFGHTENKYLARMRLRERMQKPNENVREFEAAIRILANRCKFQGGDLDERLKESLMLQCSNKEARLRCFELVEDATLNRTIECLENFEKATNESQLVAGKSRSAVNATRQKRSDDYSPGPDTVNSEASDDFSQSESEEDSRLAVLSSKFDKLGRKLDDLHRRKQKKSNKNATDNRTQQTDKNSASRECQKCGQKGHLEESKQCPARGKKCNECQNFGHFGRKCPGTGNSLQKQCTVRIAGTEAEFNESDKIVARFMLQPVNATDFRSVIQEFMVDSGADVSTIIHSDYSSKLKKLFPLHKSKLRLRNFDNSKILKPRGLIIVRMSYGGRTVQTQIQIVDDQCLSVLGAVDVKQLGLILDFGDCSVKSNNHTVCETVELNNVYPSPQDSIRLGSNVKSKIPVKSDKNSGLTPLLILTLRTSKNVFQYFVALV